MLEEEREQCVDSGHSKMDSGLIISMNERINSFLISTSKDPILSPDLQDLATTLSSQKSISYKSLRVIWLSASPSGRPALRCLFSGSEFVLQRPKPREKSEELKNRLKKLGEMSEEKAYKELVKDILPKDDPSEPFSSYKDQLGFGLHVVLMMFTGYLVGFAAFRALFDHSAVMNAAGGILGLVCSMLLETTLFIIRSSPTPPSSFSSSTHHPLSKMKKYQ